MSISLDVEKYCKNCADFEANVTKTSYEIYSDNCISGFDTTIECKNRNRCMNMFTYLINYALKDGIINDD